MGSVQRVEQVVGDLGWAQRIVRCYEAGERVQRASLQAAMQALKIKPGTLIRGGCNPANDRLASAAQADD